MVIDKRFKWRTKFLLSLLHVPPVHVAEVDHEDDAAEQDQGHDVGYKVLHTLSYVLDHLMPAQTKPAAPLV